MLKPLLRRASACLVTLGIIGLAVLPPEHVHLAADRDDHLRGEVVHRHFEPHHADFPQSHLENPDADAAYLSGAFTLPGQPSVVAPDGSSLVLEAADPAVPGFTQWHGNARDLRAHDPPWARAHALRGPPFRLA